jgi:hypothetical protein
LAETALAEMRPLDARTSPAIALMMVRFVKFMFFLSKSALSAFRQ